MLFGESITLSEATLGKSCYSDAKAILFLIYPYFRCVTDSPIREISEFQWTLVRSRVRLCSGADTSVGFHSCHNVSCTLQVSKQQCAWYDYLWRVIDFIVWLANSYPDKIEVNAVSRFLSPNHECSNQRRCVYLRIYVPFSLRMAFSQFQCILLCAGVFEDANCRLFWIII